MEAAEYDIDVIHFGDDLGTQNGLMISPDTYRKIIKPRQARLFGAVKEKTNAKILYHSCGSNIEVYEDLIEIGIDAFNPVHNIQPDVPAQNICEMFDSAKVYGEYPITC
jgi:uroporphyrinogen decarboxylase